MKRIPAFFSTVGLSDSHAFMYQERNSAATTGHEGKINRKDKLSWCPYRKSPLLKKMLSVLLMLLTVLTATAQSNTRERMHPEDRPIDLEHPTMEPLLKVGKVEREGDTLQYVELNNIYVYPPKQFKTVKQRKKYERAVYDVKKVLPIAKECNHLLIETYEYLQTLPNHKAREQHMKRVEQAIKAEYTPRMKKLTYRQGKLLIKLIHRECNSSSYQIIQAFLGPVKAGFYQAFAWVYGASLKKEFDAEGEDSDTERIINMVESGQL